VKYKIEGRREARARKLLPPPPLPTDLWVGSYVRERFIF